MKGKRQEEAKNKRINDERMANEIEATIRDEEKDRDILEEE